MTHSHSASRKSITDNSSFGSIIDNPSTIIATIPGTLGYYPQESIVLLGLVADPDDPAAVYLGPVLRADLTRASELASFLSSPLVDKCVAFLAVMVTRMPDSVSARYASELLDGLQRACAEPLIDVCWHVTEIAQGTPYTMVFGPDPQLMDDICPGLGWDHGVVGSVMNSPAMRAMRDNGTLPALSREDTFSYFDRDEQCDEHRGTKLSRLITDMSVRAHLKADRARRDIDKGRTGGAVLVHEAVRALRNAPRHPLVGDDERPSFHAVFSNDDEVTALAAVLTRSILRDCIISEAIQIPESAATALLTVARSFSGIIRANALSVWALIAIERGLSSWASAALATAQEEMPEHSMSAICMEILATGQQRKLVETILHGCADACRDLVPGLAEGVDGQASA